MNRTNLKRCYTICRILELITFMTACVLFMSTPFMMFCGTETGIKFIVFAIFAGFMTFICETICRIIIEILYRK